MPREDTSPVPARIPASHLAAIVEAADDAIISKSLDGIITTWNHGAEKIFGYTAAEAIGRPIGLILPPECYAEEPNILERIRRGEKIEHYETTRLAKDGRRIDVSVSISPVRDESGRIVGASKIARDITEQKRANDQLRLERERLQVTLASIGDGVVVTDENGLVGFLNPIAEGLTGWKQDEAKGKPLEWVFKIINETSRQSVESPVQKVMREGIAVGLANHTVLISRSGTEAAIADTAAPIRDSSGKVSGVVLVFRDVSAQRTIEEFQARLSAIVENSNDAIVGKDLDGRIRTWNKAAETIFGYTAEEAIGRPITLLIPPDRLPEETNILDRLRRGERVEHFETVRITKHRRKIDVSLTISPIRDRDGMVIGASKIARDITDKKKWERELALANQQLKEHAQTLEQEVAARTAELRESFEELETFSSSLSHDLKAPLRAMASYAQVLDEEYGSQLPSQGRELARRIAQSCCRMSRFVDNVLSYARLRNCAVEFGPVDLEKVVTRVLEEYPHARDAQAEVLVETPLLAVRGHEALLVQALANLVSNAVKFVPAGARPKLRIRTESRAGRVRLWIQDNGIGIPPADQQKLFNLFTRLPGAAGYEGSGIGLAVVQRAVRRMGGQAGVDSEPGNGSSFWMELPAGNGAGAAGGLSHTVAGERPDFLRR